ncbi:MAG: MFS transporter [Kiritimatiellae bacterium]|nr:MFS transporter [Kiritimatiellia bacterium]
MRSAMVGQCFGCLAIIAFRTGLILLYLNSLGLERSVIMTLIALSALMTGAVTIPAAWLAERIGKKRVGFLGQALTTAGFATLALSGFCPRAGAVWLAIGGIVLDGLGQGLFISVWYALLSPIVPVDFRGRFFGTLRFAWNVVGILFMLAATFVLGKDSPRGIFQCLFALITGALVIRFFFYRRIPEVETERARGERFGEALAKVVRSPGYASFSSYVFLLLLFTSGSPSVFGLLEKRVLLFGDNLVAWMGLLLTLGSILGFLLGGRAIDRFGTRMVFVACHLGFGAILSLFLLRDSVARLPTGVYVGTLSLCFGLVAAASSVAFSSELLGIMPPTHKSLAGAVYSTLYYLANGLAGAIWAALLRLGALNESWCLFGHTLSDYDTVLLLCAVMVVFLLITLTLIPSVIRKAQFLPRGG